MSGRALFLLACSCKISPFSSIYVIFLQGVLKDGISSLLKSTQPLYNYFRSDPLLRSIPCYDFGGKLKNS